MRFAFRSRCSLAAINNAKQWNSDYRISSECLISLFLNSISQSNVSVSSLVHEDQQSNPNLGPGIPHLTQQLRAPSTAAPQSLGSMPTNNNATQNETQTMTFQAPQPPPQMMQQQQQAQEQQLGFNIFGLNPVQIQHLLMLQMQQMRGMVGGGPQMGDPVSFA